MGDQPCSACGGCGMTDKVHYEIELDANGNQVSVARHVMSSCSSCGGSGRLA